MDIKERPGPGREVGIGLGRETFKHAGDAVVGEPLVDLVPSILDERPRQRADFSVGEDRKSTRLNSSHVEISYAVFCLKKKKKNATDVNSSKTNSKYNQK